MGCNGVLGRSVVSQLRAREWQVIGADVGGVVEDGVEFVKLNSGGNWADEVAKTAGELPELDLVVSPMRKPSRASDVTWIPFA